MALAAAGPDQAITGAIGLAANGLRAALVDLISQERPADRARGYLALGNRRREAWACKGGAPPLDRVKVAPRRTDEVERIEMGDWVSGWLAAGSSGEPVAGYARLKEGSVGEVIASFTLMLAEGVGSSDYSPATERFLRYDPVRSSVDYIAHIDDSGWSLEGATEVNGP